MERARPHDHPGKDEREGDERQRRLFRVDLRDDGVDDIQAEGDQAALEDGDGRGVVVEGMTVEAGAAVEVAHPPNLGPGGVDAERDDGEQQVAHELRRDEGRR